MFSYLKKYQKINLINNVMDFIMGETIQKSIATKTEKRGKGQRCPVLACGVTA